LSLVRTCVRIYDEGLKYRLSN